MPGDNPLSVGFKYIAQLPKLMQVLHRLKFQKGAFALFADADGTLLHRVGGPGTVAVDNESYLSGRALEMIQAYKNPGNMFSVSTGRRSSRLSSIADVLAPDYPLMEHGCVIFYHGNPDNDWILRLRPVIGVPGEKSGLLWGIEKELQAAKYITDSEGRLATFGVVGYDSQKGLSGEQQAEISCVIGRKTDQLVAVLNQGRLDIIPAAGGKRNAMVYVCDMHEIEPERRFVLCDDFNDLDSAAESQWAACPSHAPDALKAIILPKGYISPLAFHEGTVDMLEHVLERVRV